MWQAFYFIYMSGALWYQQLYTLYYNICKCDDFWNVSFTQYGNFIINTFTGFSCASNLVRSHTGERPYIRHVCGKSFSESDGLRKHETS